MLKAAKQNITTRPYYMSLFGCYSVGGSDHDDTKKERRERERKY